MKPRFAMRTSRTSLLIVLLMLLPTLQMLKARETDAHQQERVKFLIKQLESKNDEPDETESGGLHRQKYYKPEAQVLVYLAMHQLLAEGPAACDELVLNFKNQRYSYTYQGYPTYMLNAGQNCERLFDLIINCYIPELHLISIEQLEIGSYEKVDRAAWWKANRHRPLWEIQIERIDQALTLMQQLQKQTAPITSDVEQLRPETFQKRRQQNIETLKSLRQSLVLRKDYHVAKSIDDPLNKFIWLPWQEKSIAPHTVGEPVPSSTSKVEDPFRKPQ